MLSGLNRSGVVRRKTLLGIWFVHRRAESQTTARETQLVAEIAAGNIEQPVKELYRRYPSRLYRFGIQVLGNPGLTKEMVQESFVRPWRTAGRFNAGRGSVGAYLTVIARSAAADIRKRPSSRPLLAVEEVALPPGRGRH